VFELLAFECNRTLYREESATCISWVLTAADVFSGRSNYPGTPQREMELTATSWTDPRVANYPPNSSSLCRLAALTAISVDPSANRETSTQTRGGEEIWCVLSVFWV